MLRGFAGRVKLGRALAVGKRTVIGTLLFGVLGLAHVAEKAGMSGAALGVVVTGLFEAELAIYGEADFGGVVVFMAVVLDGLEWLISWFDLDRSQLASLLLTIAHQHTIGRGAMASASSGL